MPTTGNLEGGGGWGSQIPLHSVRVETSALRKVAREMSTDELGRGNNLKN